MNCFYGNHVCQIEDRLLRLEMDGVQWRTDATPFHVANYLYVYISNRWWEWKGVNGWMRRWQHIDGWIMDDAANRMDGFWYDLCIFNMPSTHANIGMGRDGKLRECDPNARMNTVFLTNVPCFFCILRLSFCPTWLLTRSPKLLVHSLPPNSSSLLPRLLLTWRTTFPSWRRTFVLSRSLLLRRWEKAD